MADYISFSFSVLITLLLLSGSLAEKYDNRNSENIENSYKNSRYRTEMNNNNYRYDSGNTYKADLTAGNRKYDNINEENIENSYENSKYTTKKNNNIYHYDSENSYMKDVGRGNQNNHHTGGNSPGLKYDNRNNENLGNTYKDSCYETEKNNNNYLYDSGNRYVADLTAANNVGRGNTNFGYKNNHHTDGNSEKSESIDVMALYSGYKTVKNNSSNIKDSGYRSVADLTAAKYLRRTYTNFGHQYNHHTGGKRFNFEGEGYRNNEKSESSDFVVLFIRVLVFFVSVIFVSGLGLFTSQCVAANNFFVSGNSYSSCIFIYGRQNKEM